MGFGYEDTIAAISTAMSPSGIAIVRISGPDAYQAADAIFRSTRLSGQADSLNLVQSEKESACQAGSRTSVQPEDGSYGKKLSAQKANTIHHGYVIHPKSGEILDEVLAMLMRAPHSYTGEDTVEFDCHGGILAVKQVLDAILQTGVRPAEPGEFSKRAFLNGKMDLSQAEAVMSLINAKNQYAYQSAMRQLRGSVSHEIHAIRDGLIHETAFIETALDDPEHISLDGYPPVLADKVKDVKSRIQNLIDGFASGHLMEEGINTVIIGKPNAGKSSLLNVLTGTERAIVTEIAGTTRDVLEDRVTIRGISLRLLDTAGIRETDNRIEQLGVEKSKQYAKEADLLLYVVDGSVPLDENDEEVFALLADKKAIILLNKNDLEQVVDEKELSNRVDAPVISISAKQEEGLDQLEECIESMFFSGGINFNDELYITNSRHKNALEEAFESLMLVEQSIDAGMPEDFYSIDLMAACDALGKITGQSIGEDLVNEIFSSFCLGK